MSPLALERLQAAAVFISGQMRAGVQPAAIIDLLVREHRATFRLGAATNTLRCAGVTATCTWSKDVGLLEAWRRNATVRLMSERLA